MRIIEILPENKVEYWSTIKGYDIEKMQNEFANKSDMIKFLRGKFLIELKKLISFITAWERLSLESGYSFKQAKTAKLFAAKLTSAIETANISEGLASSNIKYIGEKFNRAALYFGSIGRDFEDIDEKQLANFCFRLHTLLEAATKEAISNESPTPKTITSRKLGSKVA